MGFLGILEDKHLLHVPATVVLEEQQEQDATLFRGEGLKHGTGRHAHIVLVPQPSDDPNDPLNFSSTKKLIMMLIVGFGSILYAATVAPLLSPGLVVIATEFNRPIGDITVISGYLLLVVGATGPFVSAFSRKWGKRPVLLLSSLFGLIGTIIGSCANTYDTLLAARIVQGFSISAFESLIISMIGDLYFVHQRGHFMAMMQFIMGAASNFSAVICGPVTANLGWKYLFHMFIPFAAIECILLFLFVPETQYIRDRRYELDEIAADDTTTVTTQKREDSTQIESLKSPSQGTTAPVPPPKTFWQQTAIFTGTYSADNFLQLTIAPFAVCLNLAVLWIVIASGMAVAFLVAQSYVMAQLFSAPPYLLSASGVGYLSMGPFIGGLLGALAAGAASDPLITWAARRNNRSTGGAVYEPEYRLLLVAPGLLMGAGLMLFGYLAERQVSFYATATAHGIDVFGILFVAIAAGAYGIDAYRDMSSEIFIIGMVFKNFVFYGFSYFVNDWTARAGPAQVFYVMGGVGFALVLSAPPLFFFGKRYRSWWHRHNLLEKLHVKTHAEL
ncbi:MFS transporter [Lasiodiplodia theobromae]|uniref:MFS transporter n=1 Tax=Lasiodiplodia theobromae TaxID=45133 RepID=UPI0015C39E82|nr:MFS transporter [Lasiodiplodia theobromae]KAF4537043.1 MFS transporter [Lasiodiplodia theobromae]